MLTMRQYIERENVERFTKCLSTEIDPAKQTILPVHVHRVGIIAAVHDQSGKSKWPGENLKR